MSPGMPVFERIIWNADETAAMARYDPRSNRHRSLALRAVVENDRAVQRLSRDIAPFLGLSFSSAYFIPPFRLGLSQALVVARCRQSYSPTVLAGSHSRISATLLAAAFTAILAANFIAGQDVCEEGHYLCVLTARPGLATFLGTTSGMSARAVGCKHCCQVGATPSLAAL